MMPSKILITSYNISGFGGMETVCRDFIRLLKQRRPDITVSFVFFNDKQTQPNDDWLDNIKYTRLYSRIRNGKLRRIHYAWQLRQLLIEQKINAIITLDAIACYNSNISRKLILGRKIPLICWPHFSIVGSYKKEYLLKTDYYYAISTGITRQLIALGVDESHIFTLFNPIKKHDFVIPRPKNKTSFLYLGRIFFDGQKQLAFLFTSLANISGDWQLDIVGSGEQNEINQLKQLAKKLNIEKKINWHGWQPDPWFYIRDNIKTVSALLLTSSIEGLGMVLLEAISYGIYAISSDCPTGPEDIIKNNINGKLFPVNDMPYFINILQAIVNNKTLPSQMNIKNSILDFYENSYIERVNLSLKKILA
jgi:UDP-D-galactose:(glucosyl)LPS alpha-1,6-D-galactosyltransferase